MPKTLKLSSVEDQRARFFCLPKLRDALPLCASRRPLAGVLHTTAPFPAHGHNPRRRQAQRGLFGTREAQERRGGDDDLLPPVSGIPAALGPISSIRDRSLGMLLPVEGTGPSGGQGAAVRSGFHVVSCSMQEPAPSLPRGCRAAAPEDPGREGCWPVAGGGRSGW